MTDTREYRSLADFYDDLANQWAAFVPILRGKLAESLHWEKSVAAAAYIDMARKCSLRAGRYARLAEKTRRESREMVTLAQAKNVISAVGRPHD